MRVAIVTQHVVRTDGQGRVAYEIVRSALQAGMKVSLFAISVEPDLIALGALWIPVAPRQWPAHLLVVWEFVQRATKALAKRRGQFDIIHVFGYSFDAPHHVNSAQFVHAAWLNSPCHTFKVRRDFYGAYQWIFSWLNTGWEKRAFSKAKRVVACSRLVASELEEIGVPGERIRLIYNATDPTEFCPARGDRTAFGLPEGVVLAVFTGDIQTSRKNLDTVLRALCLVPHLHLAVVGNATGSPYVKMAERLNLASRVHFVGFRRGDVNKVMQASDLFVLLSRYEPFGNVLLEAMSTGLPVITAKTVGAASLVSGEAGIVLSNAEDEKALAAAFEQLIHDPAARHRMGAAGSEIACNHTWTEMGNEYLGLYAECHQEQSTELKKP